MKYFDQKLVTSHICYCGSQYLSLTHIHSLSIIVELLWNQLNCQGRWTNVIHFSNVLILGANYFY